uniref:Secreted protein n=1 Tax=Heterorhabditis bacteriophora TaxID=37862 RepID=A0A1I7XMW2_HETBA
MEENSKNRHIGGMSLSLATFCFTSTTIINVEAPVPTIANGTSRPPTGVSTIIEQWTYGNGSVRTAAKRFIPSYMKQYVKQHSN